jgi:hypothetical protein
VAVQEPKMIELLAQMLARWSKDEAGATMAWWR